MFFFFFLKTLNNTRGRLHQRNDHSSLRKYLLLWKNHQLLFPGLKGKVCGRLVMSRLSCCSEASADETELRVIHQKPEPSAANLKLCYRGNAGNELPHHVIPPNTGG